MLDVTEAWAGSVKAQEKELQFSGSSYCSVRLTHQSGSNQKTLDCNNSVFLRMKRRAREAPSTPDPGKRRKQ
jgi:hypothetical protein